MIAILALAFLAGSPGPALALSDAELSPPAEWVVATVGTSATDGVRAAIGRAGAQVLSVDGSYLRVRVASGAQSEIVDAVRSIDGVRYVEQLGWVQAASVTVDPLFESQWGLAAVGAPACWDLSTGSGVTVAVVDSGVVPSHPDLQGRVDMANGYDFVNNDPDAIDDEGHGTHIAGIIAGRLDGNLGSGIAPGATILPVKVLDAHGAGSTYQAALGIRWAVDHGARVLNLSWGSTSPKLIQREAIDYAVGKGAIVIAAAGNHGSPVEYPARYPGVIAVGAFDRYLHVASFSAGGDGLALCGPGVDVLSAALGGGMIYDSGTSMATPFVSGTAALLLSRFPVMSRDQASQVLTESASDVDAPGWDVASGWGFVNAGRALDAALHTDTKSPSTAASLSSDTWTSMPVTVSLAAQDAWSGVSATYVQDGAQEAVQYRGPFVVAAEGIHTLRYWSVDAAGNTESPKTVRVLIDRTAPVATTYTQTTADGVASVRVQSSDPLSGIAGLRFRVDSAAWQSTTKNGVTVPIDRPGRHSVEFLVRDRAGNSRSVATSVSVAPRPRLVGGGSWAARTIRRSGGTAVWRPRVSMKTGLGRAIGGRTVLLQKQAGSRWVTVASVRTNSLGLAVASAILRARGQSRWRWYSAAQAGYRSAASATIGLRVE